jgi:hypothetical protein
MDKEKYNKIIDGGGIAVRAICEVVGRPKEHVEKTIKLLVEKAKSIPDSLFLKSKVFEVKEQEKGLFGSFAELEIAFKKMQGLMGFCYDFLPSSVEVTDPEKIQMDSAALSSWINELQAKIHGVDNIAKQSNLLREILTKRFNTVIRTNILSHLHRGELDEETLCRYVGITNESIKPYVELLKKRGEIKFEKGKYKLAKPVIFKNEPKKSG